MKLNIKFMSIVAVAIVGIASLSVISVSNIRKIEQYKDYQNKQTKVSEEIGDVYNFLMKMDYTAFQSTVCYRDFSEKMTKLDEDFDYLLHDKITESFDDSLRSTLEKTESIWELLKNRLEPIGDILEQMQNVKLTQGIQTEIQSHGIRTSYENFPNDDMVIQLYDLLMEAHEEVEGVNRLNATMSKQNLQSTVQFSYILEEIEKKINILTIIVAVIITVIITVFILIITGNVSKQINSIKNMTSILSKKDFSVELKAKGSSEIYSLMENINNMVEQINDFFVVVKTTASRAISSGYTINDSANSTAAATSEIDTNLETIRSEFAAITTAIQKSVVVIAEMNTHIDTLVDNNQVQTVAIADSNVAVNKVAETLEHMNNMASHRTQRAIEMNDLITDGDSKVALTNQLLTDINSKLDEVKEVVTIIDSVASKTNLLSMNAAIESAHAGNAGRGFAVVAGQIRSLAEATQKNAVRISNVVQNIVSSLEQANIASNNASESFKKISEQSGKIVNSFKEISGGIDEIDNQMKEIKIKSEETSEAAGHIDSYCGELRNKQRLVAEVVDSMNDLFVQTMTSITKIKKGTQDIVERMKSVSGSSKESYKNMTDLENILEEFKTKQSVEDAVEQVDSENLIENAVSVELQNADFVEPEHKEEVEFDLDSVTEYEA